MSKGVDYDHNPFYLPSGCRGNNSLLINLTTNFNCHKYMPGVTGSFKRVPWLKTGYKYAFILASVPDKKSAIALCLLLIYSLRRREAFYLKMAAFCSSCPLNRSTFTADDFQHKRGEKTVRDMPDAATQCIFHRC
ncbi:hypothetical protein [Pantoea septica]|uniref:hypothetical protein n=1 Tax=Pantoea septica TaxID=472695 RepID=UPI00289FBA79|nr:hypothetical protein [Pantoea septica]